MNKQNVSILSTIVNFVLACLKLGAGLVVKSAGLVADGIHSSLDIVSSLVTYLGIKGAKKPADREHPYGHARLETIAGFVVAFLLLISAIWIITEGIQSIIKKEAIVIGFWALLVVVISIVINQIMALAKFKIGKKENSLALIADAEHSQADSISSVAVLIGLFLTRWFSQADGITAIVIGLYIFYQALGLSRRVADNLLDVSNPEIEKDLKEICQEQEIDLLEIRTRKIGAENFAELKIGLNKEWKMQRVSEVTKNLEKLLLERIKSLKFVVIQVVSHEFKQGYIKSKTGQIIRFKDVAQKVSLKKLGFRTIISCQNNQLYNDFGAPEYLVIDQDLSAQAGKKGNILQKKFVENPYFIAGRGHGMRFVKSIEADRVITQEIGQNAKDKLAEMEIELKVVSENIKIGEILDQF